MGRARGRTLRHGTAETIVKLLLDTHALVWWVADDPRLSRTALAAMIDPDNDCYLSIVAAWEFRWIQARSRIAVMTPLEDILRVVPLICLDLPFDLHRYSSTLPPIHSDPIDRMLVAQAIRDDMVLVSCDGPVHRYPVKTLW